MTAELAEQFDLLPFGEMKVNTRGDERGNDPTELLAKLKRAVSRTTAGTSLAVQERAAAWLDRIPATKFPHGGEWALKGFPVVDPLGDASDTWGVMRYVGPAGFNGDIKLVEPESAYWYDSTALISELSGTQHLERFGDSGFAMKWACPTQLIGGLPSVPLRVRTVNYSPLQRYARALTAAREAHRDALADLRQRLDDGAARFAQRAPRDVVEYLADDVGIGQLTTARAIGVSPTAVRKWRRGEPARAEHRSRLAVLAALAELLMELGPYDPAGWLDMPISIESTLSPLDLFVSGRSDLVLLRGANQATPQETLDAFDSRWREASGADFAAAMHSRKNPSGSASSRRCTLGRSLPASNAEIRPTIPPALP